MHTKDFLRYAAASIRAHPMRCSLTALGIAIGIGAVVLLTSIGEGVHRFVLSEFTQFGTTLVAVNPGKVTTHGASVAMFGTTRPLTIEDAEALRRVPYIRAMVPVAQGNAEIEAEGRRRRTSILGVGPAMPDVFHMGVAAGRFLPEDDPRAPRAFVVLGRTIRDELFGTDNPLGARLRIGGERYRVIGTMEPKGQVLGFDLDDAVYIPAARALSMFNREGLMEIDLVYEEEKPIDEVVRGIRRVLVARHGKVDFTITTQAQMLEVLGNVLNALTMAVGALGGISLLVGGVGILTIMTISVSERTGEIGLLRALGSGRQQILTLFLGEAIALSAAGGLAGLVIGIGGAQLLHLFVPVLPVHTPWTYVLLAETTAVVIGLVAGALPAERAARLDPVEALRAE